jgi:hypothetical protein
MTDFTRTEAIEYLEISEKEFNNYHKNSEEIKGFKIRGRWYFEKMALEKWQDNKERNTVYINLKTYEDCFEFAIKMVYSSNASHGTGIRGARSEMQHADDYILGFLAENGVQKFLKDKYSTDVKLDIDVHPDHITPQDFNGIMKDENYRDCNLGVAVKSSKWKSCFNIIPPIEYENQDRKSDIYIFVRVGLPSDHLFRFLRDQAFIKRANHFLLKEDDFRSIVKLTDIPVWICGFNYHNEFQNVTSIPGQEFSGNPPHRYVVSVSEMHNSSSDWQEVISKL